MLWRARTGFFVLMEVLKRPQLRTLRLDLVCCLGFEEIPGRPRFWVVIVQWLLE